jgi:hypothetical protein
MLESSQTSCRGRRRSRSRGGQPAGERAWGFAGGEIRGGGFLVWIKLTREFFGSGGELKRGVGGRTNDGGAARRGEGGNWEMKESERI